MKLINMIYIFWQISVAPHAGAWIETGFPACFVPVLPVAPHAGAWIETGPATMRLPTTTLRRPPRGGVD